MSIFRKDALTSARHEHTMKARTKISLLALLIGSFISLTASADNSTLVNSVYESKNSARPGTFSIVPSGSDSVTSQMIIHPDQRNKLKEPRTCKFKIVDEGKNKPDERRYRVEANCGISDRDVVGYIQRNGSSLNVGWGNLGEMIQNNIYYAK